MMDNGEAQNVHHQAQVSSEPSADAAKEKLAKSAKIVGMTKLQQRWSSPQLAHDEDVASYYRSLLFIKLLTSIFSSLCST